LNIIKKIGLLSIAVNLVACGDAISTADLEKACNEAVNWNEGSCECMAGKAKENLSPKAQQLLYASLTEDQQLAQELAENMTLEEANPIPNIDSARSGISLGSLVEKTAPYQATTCQGAQAPASSGKPQAPLDHSHYDDLPA